MNRKQRKNIFVALSILAAIVIGLSIVGRMM